LRRAGKGKYENRDPVDKMIEYSFVPNVDHPIAFDDRFKRVCPKCTECNSEKAERSSNASEERHDRMLLTLSNSVWPLSRRDYLFSTAFAKAWEARANG